MNLNLVPDPKTIFFLMPSLKTDCFIETLMEFLFSGIGVKPVKNLLALNQLALSNTRKKDFSMTWYFHFLQAAPLKDEWQGFSALTEKRL